jgi:hypothetical protein
MSSSSSRARKIALSVVLIAIIVVSAFAITSYLNSAQAKADPNVYVGIAFGGNTTEQAKVLIDKVKDYTNLFILAVGRNPISANQSKVEEVCDYAVTNGLNIIVDVGVRDATNSSEWFWENSAYETIVEQWRQRWGDKFLGMYYNDEPGGIQLDGSWRPFFVNATDLEKSSLKQLQDLNVIKQTLQAYVDNGTEPDPSYPLERDFYVNDILGLDGGMQNLTSAGTPKFTSDYGLFWWDYEGGYDTLFAELGWNCSVPEQIDLVKGAAHAQGKDWGTMITWRYNQPPYLDSGDNIYNQMMTSYQAGAKYIAVFDYPYNVTDYGALTQDHLNAMQRFWHDITTKQIQVNATAEAALVLPENFGWGLRNPTDTIWGFWKTDPRTIQVATVTSKLLDQYGTGLDIIFEDPAYPVSNMNYSKVYYWNQTL